MVTKLDYSKLSFKYEIQNNHLKKITINSFRFS